MKIYVDNLASDTTEEDLHVLFECFGKVTTVHIGRMQGRGSVEMPSKTAARQAIAGLNGQTLKGCELSLREAREHSSHTRGRKPRRRSRRK